MTPRPTTKNARLCSVVIPTCNRKRRLLRTVETIRNQTYPEVEIVVSVDGSQDGSLEALEQLADPAITIAASPRPTGASQARNRGIRAATGAYVAFCDDDDLWTPDKLQDQIGQMEDEQTSWSFCQAATVDDDLNLLDFTRPWPADHYRRRIRNSNPIPGGCSTVVVRRGALETVGPFDHDLSMFADWDMWARLFDYGEPSVSRAYGTMYVKHGGQMSVDMTNINRELQLIRAKLGYSERELERMYTGIDFWVAQAAAANGDYRPLVSALRHPRVWISVTARRLGRRMSQSANSNEANVSVQAMRSVC